SAKILRKMRHPYEPTSSVRCTHEETQGLAEKSNRKHLRLIAQNRPEPALDLLHAHSLTPGIILHLLLLDLAGAEITGLRVGKIPSRDRGGGNHGITLGQDYAGIFIGLNELPQGGFFRVV